MTLRADLENLALAFDPMADAAYVELMGFEIIDPPECSLLTKSLWICYTSRVLCLAFQITWVTWLAVAPQAQLPNFWRVGYLESTSFGVLVLCRPLIRL